MNRKYMRWMWCFPLLACFACEEQEVAPAEAPKQEITFRCFLQEGDNVIPLGTDEGGQTRSTNNDLSGGFYLFGAYNTQDMPATLPTGNKGAENGVLFFSGTEVMYPRQGSAGTGRYWVADGKTRHSFAAYSVFTPATTIDGFDKGGSLQPGFNTDRWVPSVDYYVHPNPAEQEDLLVAFGPANLVVHHTAPAVNLYFRHALSKVVLKIVVKGAVALYDVCTEISYPGMLKNHYSHYLTTGIETAGSTTSTGATYYPLQTSFMVPSSASSELTATNAGELLVQPQTVDATTPWLNVKLSYKMSASALLSSTYNLSIPGGITFKPEMQYTYYIYVFEKTEQLSISEVVIEPWVTEKKEVDRLN